MSALRPPQRVALLLHPARPIAGPLEVVQRWAERRGLHVVQISAPGSADSRALPHAEPEAGDLIVALGGDGTVLRALRVSAAVNAPVLGAACGSLGVITTVTADDLDGALERVYDGDWTPRRLPALRIQSAGVPDECALNDFVAVRRGAGQLVANVSVDDELYVRLSGDGLIVATALGSSAYSMAAGGPVVVTGAPAFVFTPLAMHGGNAPPLVVPASSTLHVELHPGFAGFEIEIDGDTRTTTQLDYTLSLHEDMVTLVALGGQSLGLTRLRDRRLISDSARILARDARQGPA
jgi:NAD+ kinase